MLTVIYLTTVISEQSVRLKHLARPDSSKNVEAELAGAEAQMDFLDLSGPAASLALVTRAVEFLSRAVKSTAAPLPSEKRKGPLIL